MNYKWHEPNKCWISDDNPHYNRLSGPVFTREEVNSKNEQLRRENSTYADLRQESYPDLYEQLDKLYHDIDGGKFGANATLSDFYLARKAVKEKFPKPENLATSTSS